MQLLQKIKDEVQKVNCDINLIELIRETLHELSPLKSQPVDRIRWVDINKVTPNDYNPNSVANIEMGLLYNFTCKNNPDILNRNQGRLPIVVIQKDINDRMASTVRHNRARGSHSVSGMSNMVFKMLENGWKDNEICNELGMQPEELLKLKHITGFSKLFENVEYKKAWETKQMIKYRLEEEQKTTK